MAASSVTTFCVYCHQEIIPLPSRHVQNMSAQTFGRLHVQHFAYTKGRNAYWCCRCACGAICVKQGRSMRSGRTQSCGCLLAQIVQMPRPSRRTHEMTGTSFYTRWSSMIGRCTNPKNHAYADYGGRGITVCPQWRASFETFAADMGEPLPGTWLERRDNNGPYSPENCYWATRHQQANNKRNNRWITHDGITQTLEQWSRATGIGHATIIHRLNHGWTIERALMTPVRQDKIPHKYRKRSL